MGIIVPRAKIFKRQHGLEHAQTIQGDIASHL